MDLDSRLKGCGLGLSLGLALGVTELATGIVITRNKTKFTITNKKEDTIITLHVRTLMLCSII